MGHSPRKLREDKPLLTVGFVRQLQAQIKADEELLKSLPSKIAANKKRLAAAMVFMPEGDLEEAVPEKEPEIREARQPAVVHKIIRRRQSKRITWSSEALRILSASGKPIVHAELFDELKKTELGKRVSEGAKGFYQGLSRLLKSKQIEKHGAYLYSAALAKQMRARGEKFPADRPVGGSAAIILDVLEKFHDGLSGPQLQEEVAQRKDAPPSVREHKNYIYNILASLKGRGVVVQEGQIYRLANGADKNPKQMELPVNGARQLPEFLMGILDDGKPRTSRELGEIASEERGLIKAGSVPGRVAHGALLMLNQRGEVKRTDDGKWVKR